MRMTFKTLTSSAFMVILGMFLVGCQNVTTSGTSSHTPKVQQSQNRLSNGNSSAWQDRVASIRERQQALIEQSRERRKIASEKRKLAMQVRTEARQKRTAALKSAKPDAASSNQKKINRAFAKTSEKKNDSLRVGWVKVDGKFIYRSKKDIVELEKAAKKEAARKAARKKAASANKRRKAVPKGNYSKLIAKYAAQHGVPYRLARAVVFVESSFRPNVTGAAGEIGLMQIRLSTARGMGYKGTARQLYNPSTNLYWGMKYLGRAHQLAGGSTCGTILKYNAGHGAKKMNPISRRYCNRVSRII